MLILEIYNEIYFLLNSHLPDNFILQH